MLRPLLVAVATMAACSGAAQAASVPDGSFEDRHFSTGFYQYNPTGSAWTFAGQSGMTGNSSAWGFEPAPDGTVVAFLQGVSDISQTLTGLAAGTTYTLSFDLAHRPGYGLNQVTVAFDGASIFTLTPTSDLWTTYTATFTAAGSSGLLSFSTANGVGDNDSGLDNVRITGAQAGAVPEAASWMMMIGGFGAIGAILRGGRRATFSMA